MWHKKKSGQKGLSIESILRCLLLKQMLGVSYRRLAGLLVDSRSYRAFARLTSDQTPKKSALQHTIRLISSETLEELFYHLTQYSLDKNLISLQTVRLDSSGVSCNILEPRDSRLLNDGVRVLSRLLAKCSAMTGIKIHFTDYRKATRKLDFKIFYSKKKIKDETYLELLKIAHRVNQQVENAIDKVLMSGVIYDTWYREIKHYHHLFQRIIDQTQRRVVQNEDVPAEEKVLSLFEEHTTLIVKSKRDTIYGHKLNVMTEAKGFIVNAYIEEGNPSDTTTYIGMIKDLEHLYDQLPQNVATDGGYASKDNLEAIKTLGIKRVMFHKKRGIQLSEMGMKQKTFEKLRCFRAGVEANISELKRVYGLTKVTWKHWEGFKAYIWSSLLSYNLMHLARL